MLSAFVKTDGPRIDLETRSDTVFALQADVVQGRVKVLTKTDCLECHCKEAWGRKYYYFYNSPRGIYSGVIEIGSLRNLPRTRV